MPCRDYYDDHPQEYFRDVTLPGFKKQIAFAESALCAALNALDDVPIQPGAKGKANALDMIDYASAGITKEELAEWRKNHAELDKKHRAEELKKARETGLAKLNDLEKKALKIRY